MKTIDSELFIHAEIPQFITGSRMTDDIYVQFRKTQGNHYRNIICKFDINKKRFSEFVEGERPSLSPGGKRLCFCRQESEEEHGVYIMDVDTHEELKIGVFVRPSEIAWSLDEKKVLFTSACKESFSPTDMPVMRSIRWMDRLKFKTDGVGYSDGSYRHIQMYDLTEKKLFNITSGRNDYSSPCFLGNHSIAFSGIPYGQDNSDEAYLFVYELDSGIKKQYKGPGGPMHHLIASPDASKIAMLSHDNHYWEATSFGLYIFDTKNEKWIHVFENQDIYFGNCVDNDTGFKNQDFSMIWEGDSQNIILPVVDNYKVNLYRVSYLSGRKEIVNEEKAVSFYMGVSRKGLVVISSSEERLAKLELISEDDTRSILWESKINTQEYELSKSQSFTYSDSNGRKRMGRYFRSTTKKKGLVLLIHGGPHYCFGYDFSFDIQFLAANGYEVVICNPAGSIGYGEEISGETYHDWGGKDFEEIMSCVSTAMSEFGMENYPAAVMGGSYGGFMTNWIISHSDLFFCAISERSTCNRYSQAGTSDCAFRYGMFEFDGLAWEHPRHYMEHSPISYVKNVHTPVLLLHGESDMNCSIEQSEEWFSALKMEGKEAYLAILPGQYHNYKDSGAPDLRRERNQLILWWLDRNMN